MRWCMQAGGASRSARTQQAVLDRPSRVRPRRARPRRSEHGVHLAALDREPRLEPGPPARLERDVAQVVARAEHHQRRVAQIGEAQLPRRPAAVDRRRPPGSPAGSARLQGGVGAVCAAAMISARSRLLREQVGDEVLRAALLDVQVDVGVGGRGSGAAPSGPATVHRLGRGAEADPAAAQPDQLLHLGRAVSASATIRRRAAAASRRPVVSATLPRARSNSGAPSVGLQGRESAYSATAGSTPQRLGGLGEMS